MIFDGWDEQKSKSVKGGIDTIMVSYDNAASENRMTRQVFYADMRMSREILMNEWDKRRFLTALEEARELLRTEIYAFCVLDDRIRLLAGGAEVRPRTIRRLLAAAMERYERDAGLRGEAGAVPSDTVIRVNIVRMEDEKDALAALRYIHLTPFSEGYTISAQDYWWTSYSTYRGHYNWTLLNIAPVMQYLSRYDNRPVLTLSEYHRRGEALRNPAPSCIRRGEFEILQKSGVCFPQGNFNETFMVQA